MSRTKWIAVGVSLITAIAAFAAFRPDTLFTDRTVDEQINTDVAAAIDQATAPTNLAAPEPADPPPADLPPVETAAPTTTAPDPPPLDPNSPVVLSTGSWRSVDHDTSGRVAVVRAGDRTTLIFDELMTDNGPDLSVWVSTAGADALATSVSGATQLETLKGNRGTQSYELPAGLDAAALRSVVIWCDRFSVGFGVADLVPA